MAKKRGKYKSNLRGYAAYKKLYETTEKKMKSMGYEMAETMYSEIEWKTMYAAEKQDRLIEVNEGKRTTTGDINRQLVKEATYKYSDKQARGYLQKKKKDGTAKGIKLLDIRSGKVKIDFDEITSFGEELEANGISGPRKYKIISQEFFGS